MAQSNIIRVDAQRGMSGSRYNLSYVPNMVNLDPFTEQGTLRLMPRLEQDTTSPVNEPVIVVSTPNGTAYFFSKTSPRIWKRSFSAAWHELTANESIQNGGHTGAGFHFGQIYYFTDTTIGRFTWDDEGIRQDNYASGLSGDGQPNYPWTIRGMLYFTNGPFIGRIDKQGNVSNNVIEIPTGQYAVALTNIGHRLRFGTISGDSGANMYVRSANNNVSFLMNGKRGDIFIDTGSQMWFRRRIPNLETFPAPFNQTNWRGLPLFGWDHRIFTYHKQEEGDHFVLCQPFTVSQGEGTIINSMSNIQTNNIVASYDGWSSSYDEPDDLDAGGDTFFVSWTKDGVSGIDILNPDKYADEGYVEYPVVHGYFGSTEKMIKDMRVFTDIIPDGTEVTLSANINNEGFSIVQKYPYLHNTVFKDLVTESKDSLRKFFEIRKGFSYQGDHAYVQPKVTLKPDADADETPIIRSFVELSS